MSNAIFNELQDKANEVDAIGGTIKFVIDDTIVYVDGSGNKNIVSNSNEDADCTISTSASALKDMQSGDLNPMTAVMSGKVKISGDMSLAMKVQSLMS
ncbi:MAG: sterol-binding protein [Flavobacteriaceae bacterium]|nr:sterol-binding protein [Flavobacteriaceae bacterium]|tara:strand:- start:2932 stop:3225 length:294 start_codon:yes stop_codon:yes gene_type:complete